jgi:ankyrin repeat protein
MSLTSCGAMVFLAGTVLGGSAAPAAPAQQAQPAATRHVAAQGKLHQAARTGDLALLRQQLTGGASPNALDSNGRTALMDAVRSGQTAAAEVLIQAGANVNARSGSGSTALIEAAAEGHADAARLLIQHGADLNAATRAGTALETAERTGHMEVASLLRKAGARSSGHSLGDTVCVRPWGGDGYCGTVEAIDRNQYQLRVTEIVGCHEGCAAKAECSAERAVGGAAGIKAGDTVKTASWCITHTGVQR